MDWPISNVDYSCSSIDGYSILANVDLSGKDLKKILKEEGLMGEKSYAERVNSAKVMLSGLRNNVAKLSRRGIDQDFIGRMEATQQKAIELDNEQESLKAKLKAKTAELAETMAGLDKMRSEAKKIVKIDIPKESWREFGIHDKTVKAAKKTAPSEKAGMTK